MLAQFNPESHPKFKSGEKSKKDVINELISQWDSLQNEGQVTKEEFKVYMSDISAIVEDDQFFIAGFADFWSVRDQYEQIESLNNKKLQPVDLGSSQNGLERNTQKFWGAA